MWVPPSLKSSASQASSLAQSGRGLKLTTHFHIVSKLRMSGIYSKHRIEYLSNYYPRICMKSPREEKNSKFPSSETSHFIQFSLNVTVNENIPIKDSLYFPTCIFWAFETPLNLLRPVFLYIHSELRNMSWAKIRASEVPGGGVGGDMEIETSRSMKKKLWFSDVN
jgi:hypothetical protein